LLVLSQVIDYGDGDDDDDDRDEDESGDDDGGGYDVDRDDDDDIDDCFCYVEGRTEIHLDFYNILKLPSCNLKMPPSFNN